MGWNDIFFNNNAHLVRHPVPSFFGYLLIRRLNTCILRKAVIPAKAGIQGLSGCRIKSGMTSYLIAGVIITDKMI